MLNTNNQTEIHTQIVKERYKQFQMIKKSVNFRMTFECLHLNQKTNENSSVFLPYLSKIGQIKKRMQIIILQDK